MKAELGVRRHKAGQEIIDFVLETGQEHELYYLDLVAILEGVKQLIIHCCAHGHDMQERLLSDKVRI